ncbi:MAG: DUF692 domain-containing protein [gamma proteobacterium symbiont of Bathyaustriella thionipta]|nr:DUF692 domain-containing protein [gamma proteobacterium symbiont of Bathyaustriella thionipta]
MSKTTEYPVHGAGLGYRRTLMDSLAGHRPSQIDFYEVAPENWINLGGATGRKFRAFSEQHDFVAHGLSLSIGSPEPLDFNFLKQLKKFLETHQIRYYSEHLSYCSDDGHLYDLMPIPFTEEAVQHVAARIRQVQEVLEQRIAMENVSYYARPSREMEEIDFLNAVIEEADCDLHLDVNNIYVNSINHQYDPYEFLSKMPGERIAYCHVAGHFEEAEDLRVDTHGADVIDPVWKLLEAAYQQFGVFPTLLERDFNIPPLPELLKEVDTIARLQAQYSALQDKQSVHA